VGVLQPYEEEQNDFLGAQISSDATSVKYRKNEWLGFLFSPTGELGRLLANSQRLPYVSCVLSSFHVFMKFSTFPPKVILMSAIYYITVPFSFFPDQNTEKAW